MWCCRTSARRNCLSPQAGRPDLYRIEASPLFDGTPDWGGSGAVDLFLLDHDAPRFARAAMARRLRSLDEAISHDVAILSPGAGFAALEPIVDRCAEARRAGSRLVGRDRDRGQGMAVGSDCPSSSRTSIPPSLAAAFTVKERLPSAASHFGSGSRLREPASWPFRGATAATSSRMRKPHSASAVPVQHCVIDPSFFKDIFARYGHADVPMRQLGAWLGAFARARGREAIFTPFLSASSREDVEGQVEAVEWAAFRAVHRPVIPEMRCSVHLDLGWIPRLPMSRCARRPGGPSWARTTLPTARRCSQPIGSSVVLVPGRPRPDVARAADQRLRANAAGAPRADERKPAAAAPSVRRADLACERSDP